MPLLTETDQNNKPLVYVKINEGNFVIKSEDGTAETKFNAVVGRFRRVWTQDDPGNKAKKIQPSVKFVLDLEDDETLYRFSFRATTHFVSSLAAHLPALEEGAEIKLKVRPGTDPIVSFASVLREVNGEWVNVDRVEMPKDETERLAKVVDIAQTHPALFVPKPKE